MDCHVLLQGIFLTQVSNLHPLHRQVGSSLLSHQRSRSEIISECRFYLYCLYSEWGGVSLLWTLWLYSLPTFLIELLFFFLSVLENNSSRISHIPVWSGSSEKKAYLGVLGFFKLKFSWFTVLCYFQVYNKNDSNIFCSFSYFFIQFITKY